MNAMSRAHSTTGTFRWLLKREYWENKGGFLWAQLITGGIAIVFAALGVLIGAIAVRNKIGSVDGGVQIDDMQEYVRTLGAVGDGLLLTGMLISATVLAFVVFFYALGSLYDDRRDRSILFWKSLPLSDAQTVLSKALWALLLAPLISIAVGLVVGLLLWLLAMLGAALAGAPNPWAMATQSHPFHLLGLMLWTVPMGLLWALPTVGWLMFCSAWARSKPFLWAVLVPLLACVMISILGAMPGVNLPVGMIWYVVAYRGLMSVWPGAWAPRAVDHDEVALGNGIDHPSDVIQGVLEATNAANLYGHPDIWIGAAVGIALIFVSIRLRRWRDEG